MKIAMVIKQFFYVHRSWSYFGIVDTCRQQSVTGQILSIFLAYVYVLLGLLYTKAANHPSQALPYIIFRHTPFNFFLSWKPMMSIFDCCCGGQKYIVFLTGPKEDKAMFCEKMFGIKLKDISFSEYELRFGGANLILQVLENDQELREVHDMHMKMANGVIYLKRKDGPVHTDKSALVVFLNGRSKQESEGNVVVSSVTEDSYADCKDGLKKLVKMIKK